ncbi:hypothetical protein QBS70_16380 [Cronobacter sakazakii]|nr:hypothetical protein [Cronobacter sakazakii]
MKEHNYTNLALDIRAIFEMHHKILNALSFPFFFEFPKDSCESASVFFGVCVKQIFPNADVKIVHGTTRGQSDYHHYWVEIDKKTYDLTLDQFQDSQNSGNVFSPMYSKQKHPLANLFYYKKTQ